MVCKQGHYTPRSLPFYKSQSDIKNAILQNGANTVLHVDFLYGPHQPTLIFQFCGAHIF